jgi:3-deoxy-D-manno-octulosonate 8-phosphate phosphatase (KDO 8-P phosphatase)
MGDDIPDYHVMKLVGLAACPQDASPEIKAISKYISHKNGGKGAARDVIEQVMKTQENGWHILMGTRLELF